MARFQRPYDSTEELYETELEDLRFMSNAGLNLAVAAAMAYCAKYGLAHPAWLSLASTKMMCELLSKTAAAGCGRSSGVTNRHRQDMIHYDRWSAVLEIREGRERLRKEIATLRALPGRRAHDVRRRYEKLLDHIGSSDLQAFPIASDMLAPTAAHGGADAIKRSFRKVEADLKDPLKAARYRILDRDFAKASGAAPKARKAKVRKSSLFVT
jgi:hypothetical protein